MAQRAMLHEDRQGTAAGEAEQGGTVAVRSVTALAPAWLACAVLPRTRGFTEAAIRLYLSGGLTVVFAALAMGFTLSVTHTFTAQMAESVQAAQTDFFITWSYWGMLLLGFISVLLHLKAATLASNISGANDGAGPAAATVAGAKLAVGAAVVTAFRSSGGAGVGGEIAGLGGGYGVPGAAIGGVRAAGGWATPRMAELARRFAAGRGQGA